MVGENELQNVNNPANIVVANAVANGLMQHPEQPQHSSLVSSDTEAFFRAQGAPITIELPLPDISSNRSAADRALVATGIRVQSFDNDYQIRAITNNLGLHMNVGPTPSVEMLLAELATMTQRLQSFLPMKNPLPADCWNFWPADHSLDTWHLRTDNPRWGNNAEASSSSGYRRPRLHLLRESDFAATGTKLFQDNLSTSNILSRECRDIMLYDQDYALEQIMRNIHPGRNSTNSANMNRTTEAMGSVLPTLDSQMLEDFIDAGYSAEEVEALKANMESYFTPHPTQSRHFDDTPSTKKKRKAKAQTPIVDDQARRSARLKKNEEIQHFQLDREPRRKNGEAKKTVYISTVEDLNTAIINRSLDSEMVANEVEPIPIFTLIDLGVSFCGVPPGELTQMCSSRSLKSELMEKPQDLAVK